MKACIKKALLEDVIGLGGLFRYESKCTSVSSDWFAD